ncbi:MAG: aspartate-semialdehyde dehydrogenase [Planctomycetota bacterium]|jgi:aspartate-semialdehyde dehydrogenase|nr:aspartate-semialdehyde dehydrogenase [Planctomycetota bacterium]
MKRADTAVKNVAVVGVTGAVGREMINCLEKRNFPVGELRVMASSRSTGKTVKFRGEELTIIEAAADAFAGIDIALMAVEADQSREFSPAAVKAGAVVVDNSSAYRMDPDCPLIVPEVNPDAVKEMRKGIIANPNCSTIIMNVPVWPLHRVNPVKRIIVSTYQAASGAGKPAMDELAETTKAWAEGRPLEPKVFPYQLAMNLFSHNSGLAENGYNSEEMKMTNETRKIFSAPEMMVAATCIRVPVMRAHCEAITLEFKNPMSPGEARRILESAPGVSILDDRVKNRSPQPLDAADRDEVFVGRIREDISLPGRGLMLWVAGDQILKGAALNAVQIAELL